MSTLLVVQSEEELEKTINEKEPDTGSVTSCEEEEFENI